MLVLCKPALKLLSTTAKVPSISVEKSDVDESAAPNHCDFQLMSEFYYYH